MKPEAFSHALKVPFQDVDAAGIVFFANLFRYAHETYERFMEHAGLSLHDILTDRQFLLPLVHAQADYHKPLRHADCLDIQLRLKRLGNTSYTLHYTIVNGEGELAATLETVHVAMGQVSQKAEALPPPLRAALETCERVR